MNPRIVEGDRWTCHACGDCCRLYELGPVEPEAIQRLERLDIASRWPPAADGWYHERTAPDGRTAYFLDRVDGHCIFLGDNNLCAVHGMYGEAAKPGFCLEYPFHRVDRGGHEAVVIRPSCTSCARTHATGQPVEEQVDKVLRLPRGMPIRRMAPEQVQVEDRQVPAAEWFLTEEALYRATGSLEARLAAAQRATVTPAEDAGRARLAGGAVLEGLRRMMEVAVAETTAEPFRRMFAADALDLLTRGLRGFGEPRPLPPDTEAWLCTQLRSWILARWYLGLGDAAAGFGVFALQVRLVQVLGPDLLDAGRIVAAWTKLTENPAPLALLRRARPALLDYWRCLPLSAQDPAAG